MSSFSYVTVATWVWFHHVSSSIWGEITSVSFMICTDIFSVQTNTHHEINERWQVFHLKKSINPTVNQFFKNSSINIFSLTERKKNISKTKQSKFYFYANTDDSFKIKMRRPTEVDDPQVLKSHPQTRWGVEHAGVFFKSSNPINLSWVIQLI